MEQHRFNKEFQHFSLLLNVNLSAFGSCSLRIFPYSSFVQTPIIVPLYTVLVFNHVHICILKGDLQKFDADIEGKLCLELMKDSENSVNGAALLS
jgi:hypothetical protein